MGEHIERALMQHIEILRNFLQRVESEASEPGLRAKAGALAMGADSILIVAAAGHQARRREGAPYVSSPTLAPATLAMSVPAGATAVTAAACAAELIDTDDHHQASEVYGETALLDFGEYPRCRKNPNGDDLGCYFTAADDHRHCIYCGEPD
jgi:hypothetical protein